MLAGIERAGQALASQGATVNEAKPDFSLAEHHETYLMHLSPIIGASFGPDEIALMERVARDLGPDDKSHNAIQARGTLLPHREWLLGMRFGLTWWRSGRRF